MQHYEELLKLLEATKEDFDKFYNKAVMKAGVRLRKGLKDVQNKIKEVRTEVAGHKRAVKAERKASKVAAPAKK
jgi:hypothetical protein